MRFMSVVLLLAVSSCCLVHASSRRMRMASGSVEAPSSRRQLCSPRRIARTGTDQISKELRYVNVTVITNRECKNSFGPIITSSKLCTDSLNANGNEGTCNGDSGGPLIITEPSDGEPTLIGVVSFGAESCEAGVPSAYTRVTSHLDWIANNDAATLHTTGVLFCMSLLLHAILTRQ
ncbi:hypothetical protein B566_EDAN011635 [Ephemera danica]|nr:hypothetical protein B566_EDAN011635 [Ephemera danica]